MTSEHIIAAIQGDELDSEELQSVAMAALSALFGADEVDAEVVAELDSGTGGRFTREAVEEYRQNESVHELIRLLVARTQSVRTSDLVHEAALHHWKQDGLEELLRTLEGIKRDIRQREQLGLAFAG